MKQSIITDIEQKSPTSYLVKLSDERKYYIVSSKYSPSIIDKKAGDTIVYTKKGKYINLISLKDIAIDFVVEVAQKTTEAVLKTLIRNIFK